MSEKPLPDEKIVKVQFVKNDVIVSMRDTLANIYIGKGKARLVKEAAPEPVKDEAPKDEPPEGEAKKPKGKAKAGTK